MTNWTDMPANYDLAGKVIVVTGGSRGMGLAIVRGAQAVGATVVAMARDRERLDRVISEAADAGAHIEGVAVNLADDEDRDRAFGEVIERHGRIDGLVNNAGINKVASSLEYDLRDLRQILEVNVVAVFACAQAAARVMPNGGSIVNTASISSFIGQPERAAYVASKAAVLGITRALAVEWGEKRIRINAIAPGYVETDITRDLINRGVLDRGVIEARTPLRRFGQPEDVVAATLFLLSDASSFVSGATLTIDGGWLANGYIR